MNGIKWVANWFLYKYYSYIRVYGTTEAPHLFPYFILDHFLLREIVYFNHGIGVTTLLKTNNKTIWLVFPIQIGSYTISIGQNVRKEAEALQELILCLGEPKEYDPHEMEIIHVRSIGLTHPNIHVFLF
jgi:hypothetical protein